MSKDESDASLFFFSFCFSFFNLEFVTRLLLLLLYLNTFTSIYGIYFEYLEIRFLSHFVILSNSTCKIFLAFYQLEVEMGQVGFNNRLTSEGNSCGLTRT